MAVKPNTSSRWARGFVARALTPARPWCLAALALLAWAGAPRAAPPAMFLPGEVLTVLEREFVDAERLDARAMLLGALEEAARAYPALLCEPDPGGDGLRVRVRTAATFQERRFPLPGRLADLRAVLQQVQAFLAEALPPEPAAPDLVAQSLARGLVGAVDPYGQLLLADAPLADEGNGLGRGGGVGMGLGQRAGYLTVRVILPGLPAEKAGLRVGDRLLRVGDRQALELRPEVAERILRGAPGTAVLVQAMRPGEAAPRRFHLTRVDEETPAMEGRLLRPGTGQRIGYVRVRGFGPSTASDLRAQVSRFQPERPDFLGIVLDLRGNPGGLLDQAFQVVDLFLDNGLVANVERPRTPTEMIEAHTYRTLTQAPLVVLVNERSASAAEIVAAALKHNRRALVIGAPTFGKHAIQSVFPLAGGNALKVTVARYTLPGAAPAGRVPPHVRLLAVAAQAGSGDLRGLAPGADEARIPAQEAAPLMLVHHLLPGNELASADTGMAEGGAERDLALTLAQAILFANNRKDFGSLVQTGLDLAAAEQRRQAKRIQEHLGNLGVTWATEASARGARIDLERVDIQIRGPHGGRWRRAGRPLLPKDEVRLGLTVRNTGSGNAQRVLVQSRSEAETLDGLEFPFGALAAGEARTASRTFRLPADQPAGGEGMELRLYMDAHALVSQSAVVLPIGRPDRARLRVTLEVADAAGRPADPAGAEAEPPALRVALENEGEGASGEVGTALSRGPDGPLWGNRAGEVLAALAPGAIRRLEVPLRSPRGEALPRGAEVRVADLVSRAFFLRRPLLPGGDAPAAPWRVRAPTLSLDPLPPAAADFAGRLAGSAEADHGVTVLLVRLNGRGILQIFPDPAAGASPVAFRVPFALKPGRNLVEVEVRDADGFTIREEAVQWQGAGAVVLPIGPNGG